MDGVPIMRATVTTAGGSAMRVAHWGLYASGSLDQGVQYNDDIQIWTLDGPWTDFDREPPSPYTITAAHGAGQHPLRVAQPRAPSGPRLFGLDGRLYAAVPAAGLTITSHPASGPRLLLAP
jgi:hypothetical protein